MRAHVRVATAAVSLALIGVTSGGPATAETRTTADQPSALTAPTARVAVVTGATLTASAKQVTEGDRVSLTATIKTPRQASKVTLQRWQQPLYDWSDPTWESVKTLATRGKATMVFNQVATANNFERYRVVTTYKNAMPFTSKAVNVTVWRWIPLSEYNPYYETGGTIFGNMYINGQVYTGWGAASYSHVGTWESRFTPGRHCTNFRAILGASDISGDGASATVTLTADDTVAYESPTLTPGMSVPINVALAKPYRIGIRLFDTTPGGNTGRDAIETWPVLGEPALRCTGV